MTIGDDLGAGVDSREGMSVLELPILFNLGEGFDVLVEKIVRNALLGFGTPRHLFRLILRD